MIFVNRASSRRSSTCSPACMHSTESASRDIWRITRLKTQEYRFKLNNSESSLSRSSLKRLSSPSIFRETTIEIRIIWVAAAWTTSLMTQTRILWSQILRTTSQSRLSLVVPRLLVKVKATLEASQSNIRLKSVNCWTKSMIFLPVSASSAVPFSWTW